MEIGVRVLNEGTDVWAMVPAQQVAANVYVILDNSVEAELDCELEFKAGDLVAAMDRMAEGSCFPVAVRIYAL